ncbi:MAG: sulfatase [Anaerolineae bacterium]|nr:sulfatase [Anaerolineae bacterium]
MHRSSHATWPLLRLLTLVILLSSCIQPAQPVTTPDRPLLTPTAASIAPTPTPAVTPTPAAAPASRPNILFIVADDLDAASVSAMPQVQALLRGQGLTFTQAFVTNSVCCPSRTTFLRGQYTHSHHIYTNRAPDGGFELVYQLGLEQSTVATWLHDAGYRTALFGKYLNNYPETASETYMPPGWDEWYATVRNGPYQFFDYDLNENGAIVHHGTAPEDYLTDVLGRQATSFITRSVALAQEMPQGAPFFVYLAPYAPHKPSTPAPRHARLFANVQAPQGPSFDEEDVSDKPAWVSTRRRLNRSDLTEIDREYRNRLRSLQAVDEMVASLIGALQASGAISNTYLFFTSDNGYHQGQHRLPAGKTTAYEEDIRVPLFVIGPGVPAGASRAHLTLNTDLAPTFAALAGVVPPAFVEGRSLLPLLASDPPAVEDWRACVLIEHKTLEIGDPPTYEALRTPQFLYVEYTTGEHEFYDLILDPHELENRYASADVGLLRGLHQQLSALRQCQGAACGPLEDAPLLAQSWYFPVIASQQTGKLPSQSAWVNLGPLRAFKQIWLGELE